MAGRRDDSHVVNLFDSIELDCSKWTFEERESFRTELGSSAAYCIASLIASVIATVGSDPIPDEGISVALNGTTVRGLQWIARRRRKPGLAFADVEIIDTAGIGEALINQVDELLKSVTLNCGSETLALCLGAMLASACDRKPLD